MRARLNYSHRKPEQPTPVVVNVRAAQPAQQQITEQDVWLTSSGC